MKGRVLGVVSLLACLGGASCAPGSSSETASPGTSGPTTAGSTAEGAAPRVDPFEDGGLPRVRDRDPEEERRKMSLSQQESRRAKQFLGNGRLDEAALHARQALKVHEQNVDAMLVLAEVFYKQGKYELTQTVASSVLGVDARVRTPQQESRAHNLRGFALVRMGRSQAATMSFRKAAEVDAENSAAWNNLGTRYLAGGDTATATKVFEYALELDGSFPQAHLNLGAAYRAARRWQDAERQFQRALQLQSDYPEAHFNLGVLYLDAPSFPGLSTTQRLQKAITHFTRYREKALASGSSRTNDRPEVAGRGKQAPQAVSPARADEYIAVAKKGIEREERRREREAKRGANDKGPSPANEAATRNDEGPDQPPGANPPAKQPDAPQPSEPPPPPAPSPSPDSPAPAPPVQKPEPPRQSPTQRPISRPGGAR